MLRPRLNKLVQFAKRLRNGLGLSEQRFGGVLISTIVI